MTSGSGGDLSGSPPPSEYISEDMSEERKVKGKRGVGVITTEGQRTEGEDREERRF